MTKELLDTLRHYKPSVSSWYKPQWGVYVDGELIAPSDAKIYNSAGVAKQKAIESLMGRHLTPEKRKEVKQALEDLITAGFVEIKQII